MQDENLEGHLLSPDFFDAERFPRVSFESTSIARDGDTVTVEGELELRGVKRPVTLTGSDRRPGRGPRGREDRPHARDRRSTAPAFGMNWNMELPGGGFILDNEVTLTANLEFGRRNEMPTIEARHQAAGGERSSGSPGACGAIRTTAGSCSRPRELFPAGIELELFDGLKAVPPYDEDDDGRPSRPGGERAPRRDRARRRRADRDAGVQLLGPGCPEERDRLGVTPARRRGRSRQAGRRDRREHRLLRRRVGAGRAAKILRTAGARVVDGEVAVPRAHVRLEEDGRLLDDEPDSGSWSTRWLRP